MTAAALLDEILRLPVADRIRLVEEIWDSIATDAAVEMPEWHRQELDSRLDDPTEKAVFEHDRGAPTAKLSLCSTSVGEGRDRARMRVLSFVAGAPQDEFRGVAHLP
jgi:putative addiction module component (TIGR02574 family)